MNKIRNTILSFLVVMFVFTPLLSVAQNAGGVITQAQLQAYEKARVSTHEILSKANANEQDPAYQAALTDLMEKCADIGDALQFITGTKYSTAFASKTLYCTAGTVNRDVGPLDKFGKDIAQRDFSVSSSTVNYVQTYMLSILAGEATKLDKTIYDDITKRGDSSESSYGVVSKFVNMFVEGLGNTGASVLAFIAASALYVLSTVIEYTQSWPAPNIVDRGWTIVRDFMNIFFIIALILMGLGTILRFDSYSVNSKGLLFNLILMALLINFSKIIAETLIDFSDMLVNLFAPKDTLMGYGKTIYSSYVTGGDATYGYVGGGRYISEGIGNVITKLVGLTILTISYLAIAGLMFVREVGLWFLVMVSPVAYALNVIPYTKNYAHMWWSEFLKYLTWGPIAMFFFRLAYIFMQDKSLNKHADSIIDNLFIAAFVFGGFLIAKKTGAYGSQYVTSYADKAFSKAKGYGSNAISGGARASGNLLWRGEAAGAGAWVYNKGKEFAGAADPGTAKASYVKTRDAVGGFTAKVQNIPANFQQKWIKNPNADREKLVKSEQRKMQIRRGYFKMDEDAAKKLSAEDLAFAIDKDKWDESFLRSVLQNGSNDAKFTVLRAFAENKVKEKQGFDKAQYTQLWHDYRAEAFKMAGGKKDDPAYEEYMGGKNTTPENDGMSQVIHNNLEIREKKGYDKDAAFAARVKNTYVRPKPVRKKRQDSKTPTTETPSENVKPRSRPGFGPGRGGRPNETDPAVQSTNNIDPNQGNKPA